ncbi:hypothetical protein [Streptomyces sp. 11-1-2]|uniref:hypothetical protein n=1 Tax=unclassified Streptomyces TaxID=2593676 RepID=UPI0013C48AB5|nr:hypothetical protein [Streptomyces sp. 11-1-2]
MDRFLDRFRDDPGTAPPYAETLVRLRALVGDQFATGDLIPEVYEAVMARWDEGAANTWNKHLSALNSFAAYTRRQDWLAADPGGRLERRKVTRDRDKAVPWTRLERLFTDDRFGLRERVLWRMAYETCARADELLELDVPDIDMEFRRGRVGEKGGDTRTCTGRPPPPGCCRACSRDGRPVRCSSPTADRRPPTADRRPPCARYRPPTARAGGHRPHHGPEPTVLSARGVPVQAGIRTARPARQGLHAAPAAALRAQTPR